ncbi:MAG: iron-sulfur cluster-binding domain-containing protein [Kofleriaceae bacterium]
MFSQPLLPAHYVELFASRKARVVAVRDEVPGVRTITLSPARGWRMHRAGQHVTVGLAVNGRITTRTYTISSAPGSVELTVKAQGLASQALIDAPVGTFVTLGPAQGDFVLPYGAPPKALFVTAGSGITPIASMLRSLEVMPDIVHVHYTRGEMIFGDELRAIRNANYRLIVVDTSAGRSSVESLVPDLAEREAWACGPVGLLDDMTALYADRPDKLHVERFRARLVAPPNATGGAVQFHGRKFQADGVTPLLRVAEAAGLTPAHGCRMGICHACDTTLVAGCVRDLRTGDAIAEPGARIQLCVCAAAGDVELGEQQ